MVGKRGQPDKGHLEENDVVLKVIFPLTDMFTYMVVENMDREELLAQIQSYHELYGRSSEMTVETFLEGQGARLIPWYDSAGLMVEKPVCFYDFEYEYDTGIVNVAAFSVEEQAEMLISRAEYQGTVFDGQDKNLIIEYAKKFDDMDAIKALIRELAEAERDSDMQAAQKVREHARAEMDKFPDRTLGLSAMHRMGYHDDSMLPLTRERALELYRDGLDIYSLQADGRAFLMALEGDFYEEKGIFGIKAEEWEDYREMEPVKPPLTAGQTEQDAKISFYVAECMEFPVLGEYHENIGTLQEAMELYEKIPSDRMHGVKGIGFCLEDGSIYAGKFELMSGREVLAGIINDIPHYKESQLVQKAVADMEAILSGQGSRSVTGVEKEPERHQKPAGALKAVPEETKTKAAVRQKAGEEVLADGAGRGASDSRKQSVLNAVRERQAKMKEEKQVQKARARRKAAKKSGMEL